MKRRITTISESTKSNWGFIFGNYSQTSLIWNLL